MFFKNKKEKAKQSKKLTKALENQCFSLTIMGLGVTASTPTVDLFSPLSLDTMYHKVESLLANWYVDDEDDEAMVKQLKEFNHQVLYRQDALMVNPLVLTHPRCLVRLVISYHIVL